METDNTRDWEERFDERFIPNDGNIPTYIENGNDLKDFIHQELQKARETQLEELIREVNSMWMNELLRKDREDGATAIGYSRVIAFLTGQLSREIQSNLDQEANVPKEKRNFIKSQPTLDHPTISK